MAASVTHAWIENELIVVQVREGGGQPLVIRWKGLPRRVQQIVESWQMYTNWWESSGDIRRTYFALITQDGLFCVIYQDLLTQSWYLAKVYD